jgi:hypothetical protein
MDQLLTFEFEEVQNSIVTPNSIAYGDYLQPYSFIEFLKNTNNNYTPKVYNEFYIEYLKRWSNVKSDIVVDDQVIVSTQYADLLREVSLTYSTLQERRFLSNIDFSDPEDLEIAIPFFSRKIKEIVLLYKSSRDKLTFQVEKNKRKGTESSVQVALRDNIIRYLLNSDRFSSLNIDLSSVNENIKIQIDDLVDEYGGYFDLPTQPSASFDYGSTNRELFYSANTNSVDYTDFIDLTEFLKKNIFNQTFLTEIGKSFTINTNITYDPICQPDNPIGDFLEEQTVGGVTPEQYRQLRGDLIRKFIGVDYYYIVKNEFDEIASGLLFKADNPSGNLLNVSNASTATLMSDQLKSLRKVGLYFAPEKQSAVRFNKTTNTYAIDVNSLQPNITYVYPDPELYGKEYDSHYPIVFYYDTTSLINSQVNANTFGDPLNTPKSQNFYAYYSTQQTFETDQVNDRALQSSFSSLYDLGYVQDFKNDIYGNEYGIIKGKNGEFSKALYSFSDIVDTGTIVKMLPLNGWLFNDPISGANFNYDESGIYTGFDDVVKSGISLSGGELSSSAVDYYLNFREFTPYQGIPASYDLYPGYFDTPLLRVVPVSGSRTEYSSITGDYTVKTITDKENLNGTVYVRNTITGIVSTLSSALDTVFSKYSQSIKTQLYGNDVLGFDLFYDTIVVRTPNYLVFDKIAYNETGFIKPTTFNIYLSTDTSNQFEGFSNLFFDNSKNIIIFCKTAILSSYQNDTNKIIYPEIYKFDIDKHLLTKLFPSQLTTVNSISSNFSFIGVYSASNIIEIGSQQITYNKSNDLYCINYIGYDGNKSPYIFDYKFEYDGEDLSFKYSNVYDTGSYKVTSNFYALSDNGVIYISRIPGNQALYYNTFNYNVSSSINVGGIILNNQEGYIQL